MSDERKRPRTRYEIFADILEVAQRPTRLTRITFVCNLNPANARGFIIILTEAGLIRLVGEQTAYESTDKGRRYLEAFRLAQQLVAR